MLASDLFIVNSGIFLLLTQFNDWGGKSWGMINFTEPFPVPNTINMKKSILAFLFCAFSLSVAMSQNFTFQGKAVSSIFVRPGMRYFNREKIFYNYVMLHAIYRFNIGGK